MSREVYAIVDDAGELVGVWDDPAAALEGAEAAGIVEVEGEGLPGHDPAPSLVPNDRGRRRVVLPQVVEPTPRDAAALTGIEPVTARALERMSLAEAHARLVRFYEPLVERYEKGMQHLELAGMVDAVLTSNKKLDLQDERHETAAYTIGLALLPHSLARKGARAGLPEAFKTLCAGSVPECRASCLVFTGQNVGAPYNYAIKQAKTRALLEEPVAFVRVLEAACRLWGARNAAMGAEAFVRLNVYSDVPWELVAPGLLERLPLQGQCEGTRLYDYTKVPGRRPDRRRYHLTLSWSGWNEQACVDALRSRQQNVAMVFLLPGQLSGDDRVPESVVLGGRRWRVINGLRSDCRPRDPDGVVVGLRYKVPKGGARASGERGFLVTCQELEDGNVVVREVPWLTQDIGEEED